MIAIIQARMSSRRFPGKVLAPFHGRPIIAHVCDRVGGVLGRDAVVVATSLEPSDDPLVAYLDSLGIASHRGPLDDVLGRFVSCARGYPGRAVLRISADSPALDEAVIRRVVAEAKAHDVDLVTTTCPRTFPKGTNAEILSAAALVRLDRLATTPHHREHVTAYAYEHPDEFTISNVTSGDPGLAATSVAVDTVEDLIRLEAATADCLAGQPCLAAQPC